MLEMLPVLQLPLLWLLLLLLVLWLLLVVPALDQHLPLVQGQDAHAPTH